MFSAAIACILSVTAVGAPKADDPKSVMNAAIEACRNVQNARYHTLFELRDELTPRKVEGDVAFVRWPPQADEPPPLPPKPNLDGSVPAMPLRPMKLQSDVNADVRVELTGDDDRIITFNREAAMGLDRAERKLFIMAAADGGEKLLTGDTTFMLVDTPLLRPERLDRLLSSDNTLTSLKREKIGEVECDVVSCHLPKPDAKTDITMEVALGVDDHLPRRTVFEQITDGKQTMRHTTTITGLQVNMRVNASQFSLTAPEGYTTENIRPEQPKMLEKGDKAPAFTLKNADGKDISLGDFKGRIVLIDFWGTWCGPCQMAMPAIQKVYAKYKDKGVVTIGISCREKPGADPAKMMKDKGCDYSLLLNGEKITRDWHVPGYPTLYLIDRDGKIAYSELGYDQELEAKVSEAIDALLR